MCTYALCNKLLVKLLKAKFVFWQPKATVKASSYLTTLYKFMYMTPISNISRHEHRLQEHCIEDRERTQTVTARERAAEAPSPQAFAPLPHPLALALALRAAPAAPHRQPQAVHRGHGAGGQRGPAHPVRYSGTLHHGLHAGHVLSQRLLEASAEHLQAGLLHQERLPPTAVFSRSTQVLPVAEDR